MPLCEPTELRYWDKSRAYNGYTLFSAARSSYLIDMEGNLIHQWPIGNRTGLMNNGHLFDAFQEMDWDGNKVWEYTEKRKNYVYHHDYRRIFNKKLNAYTVMYIANKAISHDEAIAAGCDPAGGPYKGAQMDTIVEIDLQGNVIWEWWFFDHVIQDFDPTKKNFVGKGKTLADYPGKLNLNLPGRPLRQDWLHCNSMDYNEDLDQVVTNSVQGEFYVIDHGKTFVPGNPQKSIELAAGPAGDFIYRFGDPARYGQGEPPSITKDWTEATTGQKQIGGAHNIQWIKKGLHGAGNFLIFNNGQYLSERTPQSYIFEINPFLDAQRKNTGHYVNPPEAGYYIWGTPDDYKMTHKHPKQMSNQIVWIYGTKRNTAFFSHIGSGCERLPNGNTLICGSTEGHIFEVTSEGELVWEYICPVMAGGEIVKALHDRLPMSNTAGRAYRYAPDHPALAGRDLKPKGTLTGRKPFINW